MGYGIRLFSTTAYNAKHKLSKMGATSLTIGQQAIINGYLAGVEPSVVYDAEPCLRLDTETIAGELDGMAIFDYNALADHLAFIGYHTAFVHRDCIYGWILKRKDNTNPD